MFTKISPIKRLSSIFYIIYNKNILYNLYNIFLFLKFIKKIFIIIFLVINLILQSLSKINVFTPRSVEKKAELGYLYWQGRYSSVNKSDTLYMSKNIMIVS